MKRFEVFDGVSDSIKKIIHRGKRLLEQVKQGAVEPINIEAQLYLISLGTVGFFDNFTILETKNFKDDVTKIIRSNANVVNIDIYKDLNIEA
jgi:F0F1-type ATP synthase alpha subunit